MTLYRAIEAAREVLSLPSVIDKICYCHITNLGEKCKYCDALSTLPAKPMSEERISQFFGHLFPADYPTPNTTMQQIIRALRDAGVLYVEEKL